MTTCRKIITTAYRMSNVIGAGDNPSSEEADEGMEELQSLYDLMVSNRAFGDLREVFATADAEAEENTRITKDTGVSITLPTTIVNGDTRAVKDLACVEIVGTGASVFDNGAWVALYGLTLDSAAPLAHRGKNGLSAMLGESLAARHGVALVPQYVRMARNFNAGIIGKLRSSEAESSYF